MVLSSVMIYAGSFSKQDAIDSRSAPANRCFTPSVVNSHGALARGCFIF